MEELIRKSWLAHLIDDRWLFGAAEFMRPWPTCWATLPVFQRQGSIQNTKFQRHLGVGGIKVRLKHDEVRKHASRIR